MREHPIPQDITGYRFHIVGNMTIKQFAEIGLGCAIGFMFYSTNLIPVIKWPLIGLSIGFGAMVAFVPFEERPLDHWFITFFKVLYKPTKFFWRRNPKVPDPFLYNPNSATTQVVNEIDLTPAKRQRIKEYLQSVHNPLDDDPYELNRIQEVSQVLQMFDEVVITQPVSVTQQKAKPNLKVRERALNHDFNQTTIIIEETPTTDYVVFNQVQDQQPSPIDTLPTHTLLAADQVAGNISIPDVGAISIEAEQQTATPLSTPDTAHMSGRAYDTSQYNQPTTATQQATTNENLPFPIRPTEPNKLVGMVLSPSHDLINDAIIEIKKQNGSTVRAVKTNALGQFFITTPLANGTYTIEVEKEGVTFNPLEIVLSGQIMDPIEIRSL